MVEEMQLNGKSISEEREGRISKRVLIVAKGFDVSVPAWVTPRKRVLCLESKLRDLFSSCGKIKSVCIPHAYYSSTIERSKIMIVRGYDTSLPKKLIKRALSKHFSSCGEVLEVELFPNKKSPNSNLKFAFVSIYGQGAKEKALQLSGSDMGGFKLVVEKAFCPKPPEAGGISPPRDRVWAPSYLEYMAALRNKRMENPDTNKSKEDPNTNKRKEPEL